MMAALERASTLARDKLGGPNGIAKAFSDLQAAGNLGATPLVAQRRIDSAQTVEERIRAALAAMSELEQRGQKLAVLDLGETIFGRDFAERLRQGRTTVAQFAAEVEAASRKQLFSADDARRAVELSEAIEDVMREINQGLEVSYNLSGVAETANRAWLVVLKTVRDVVDTGNKSIVDAINATTRRKHDLSRQYNDTAQSMEQNDLPYLVNSGDTLATEQMRSDIQKLRDAAAGLAKDFNPVTDAKIGEGLDRATPPVRVLTVEIEELAKESQNVAGILPDVAGKLSLVGNAAGQAASQVASVAAGIRAIQNLNPDLSGALSFIDKAAQVEGAYRGTQAKARDQLSNSGDTLEYEKAMNDALTQRERALKAIKDQQDKGVNDYIRGADRTKLSDEARAVADVDDKYSSLLKQRQADYEQWIRVAATPEDVDRLQPQADAEYKQIDVAKKLYEEKARADAARKAASAAGSETGDDAYDSALKRARDQIQELELQAQTAGKATEAVYRLTEANRLRRAAGQADRLNDQGVADEIERTAADYARQRKATEDIIEAQRRLQEGQKEIAQEFLQFAEDVLLGGSKIAEAFTTLSKSFASSALKALISGEGSLAGLFGTASTEKGQLGGLLGGKLDLTSLFGGTSSAAGSPLAGAQGPSLPGTSLFGGLFDADRIADALGIGAETGIGRALSEALKPSKAGGGVLSSPLGGGLMAAGAGASIGYSSQSPVVGVLGGALAGFAATGGNPIGAVVGAGAGLLGESEAKAQAKKKLQQEIQARREALEQARPQIEAPAIQFEGGSIGTVGKSSLAARTRIGGSALFAAAALLAGRGRYIARGGASFAAVARALMCAARRRSL